MTYQVAKNKHFGHVINGVLFFLKKERRNIFLITLENNLVLNCNKLSLFFFA